MSVALPGFRIPVRGGSMQPTLADGDQVEVDPAGPFPPRVGEVVLALAGAPGGPLTFCLHRVIRVSLREVLTQGDALSRPDPPLAPERIVGVARLPRRRVFARRRAVGEAVRERVRRLPAGRFWAALLRNARWRLTARPGHWKPHRISS